MDENKMFELLEKIYVEVKGHTEQFSNVESRLGTLENDIKNLGATIDAKLIPTTDALLDGYKDNSEHITIIDDKLIGFK